MRNISFVPDFIENPYSSVLVTVGRTKVLATISVEQKAPSFVNSGEGWLTAEYALMPASTDRRVARKRKNIGGRTAEIQRLIGRSLRMAVDRTLMPDLTLIVDTDVLQADGGTRTAAINGGMLALYLAGEKLVTDGLTEKNPVIRWIGAISAGVVDGENVVDLDYAKDSSAASDFNFVFSETGEVIEIQGTAEKDPVNEATFLSLISSSKEAIFHIIEKMKEAAENR